MCVSLVRRSHRSTRPATVYFRYGKLDRRITLALFVDIMLWIAFVSITLVAIYALRDQISKFVAPLPSK